MYLHISLKYIVLKSHIFLFFYILARGCHDEWWNSVPMPIKHTNAYLHICIHNIQPTETLSYTTYNGIVCTLCFLLNKLLGFGLLSQTQTVHTWAPIHFVLLVMRWNYVRLLSWDIWIRWVHVWETLRWQIIYRSSFIVGWNVLRAREY